MPRDNPVPPTTAPITTSPKAPAAPTTAPRRRAHTASLRASDEAGFAAMIGVACVVGALSLLATNLTGCTRASAPTNADATRPPSTTPSTTPSTPTPTAQGSPAVSPNTSSPTSPAVPAAWADVPVDPTTGKVTLTDDQWKQRLSTEQFRILRQKGTERAFSGKLWNTNEPGEYRCAACGNLLFVGDSKFISECGWPAFDRCIKGSIEYLEDRSYGMVRTEVVCSRCKGHLGHVFDDGPTATGTRYCINSVSIAFIPASQIPPATPTTTAAPAAPAPNTKP